MRKEYNDDRLDLVKRIGRIVSISMLVSVLLVNTGCPRTGKKNEEASSDQTTASTNGEELVEFNTTNEVLVMTEPVVTENEEPMMTDPVLSDKTARIIRAEISEYDSWNNSPIYTMDSVDIEPGFDYKNYLLEERPAGAPNRPNGTLDLVALLKDLGANDSEIHIGYESCWIGKNNPYQNTHTADGLVIGSDFWMMWFDGTVVCEYDPGLNSGWGIDGINLYYFDNETGKYEYCDVIHCTDNNFGALELMVRAYYERDPNPFD